MCPLEENPVPFHAPDQRPRPREDYCVRLSVPQGPWLSGDTVGRELLAAEQRLRSVPSFPAPHARCRRENQSMGQSNADGGEAVWGPGRQVTLMVTSDLCK